MKVVGGNAEIGDDIWFSDKELGVLCGEFIETEKMPLEPGERKARTFLVVKVPTLPPDENEFFVDPNNSYLSEDELLEAYL